jgi:hypothetical protein
MIVAAVIGSAGTARADAVPAPPSAQQDRVGVYHWGPDAAPDKLNWGANAVAALGSRTIRVALSTRDDYGVNNGAAALSAIARRPAYASLFGDPRFSTYLLTAYFLIGEFGAARDISGECDAAVRARAAILALESWGASYARRSSPPSTPAT